MRASTKMSAGGFLTGLLLASLLGLAIPLSLGSVAGMNNHVRGLEPDEPVLTTNATTGYDVTYVYEDANGEEHRKNLTASLDDLGATSHAFHPELRVLGIDLGTAGAVTPNPAYSSKDDYDHYVIIETPDLSNLLWEKTVVSACFGFVLERGDTGTNPVAQDYRVEIGAGSRVLHSVTLAGEETTGDADTTKKGTCQGREDESDQKAEYDATYSITDIQDFLLDAYVRKDASDPASLYMKVYGPRAMISTANATEDGDAFDVAYQFYTWGGKKAAYNDVGLAMGAVGVVAWASALLATTAFQVPGNDLLSARARKVRGDAGGQGGDEE